ncbi:MAG TPA: endonuclease MutS2 [Candidatus Acidoferrales bacterium]|nr:endonuclease MutS2 [Candidatus Acidoferrales bacterium]
MRPRDLTALEFDTVRDRLADFACSPAGKEACRTLVPSPEPAVVAPALDAAWQCFRLVEEHGQLPLSEFADVRAALRTAAHEGAILDGTTLVEIRTFLSVAHATRAFLRKHVASYPALAALPERLTPLPALQATLTRALDDGGGVTDDASDELAEVRRTLRQLRDKLTRRLEQLLARPGLAEVIADRYVTLRNNRFVVPIKTAAAGRFEGVVQDRSVSGETTFIEPLFAVELNNQMLIAAKDEERLVRRILADLTALVRADVEPLASGFAALVDIDTLAARAVFAQRYHCTQPQLDDDELLLRQARHPLLLFAERPVTPIDLLLPRGKRVLVVTGPNTGGKTVALKTLGLMAVMAQSGMLIPVAEGGRLPCFRGIYADVGDEQSIARNLSTFSAHVANLTAIIERHDTPALVLLDEPGVGTDPDDGAALGIGMVRILEAGGARVALSTHYAPVKVFALSHDTCVAAAVDFDVEVMAPRYRLVYHSVGESLALPIARRLGLPEGVLEVAETARSEQAKALAAALTRLEETRRRYEERLTEVDARARATAASQREVDSLLDELQQKRRRRWADELAAARDFVRAVREQGQELLAAVERGAAERRALARWAQEQEAVISERATVFVEPAAAPAAPPHIGDEVEVADKGIRGRLQSVEGERAWIQRGSLRFEVPAGQLRRVEAASPKAVEVRVEPAPEGTEQEISLLGLRAREALAQLEDFLDRAARARHPSVRIIHGVGSGALRRAVQEYLSRSPYCAHFRLGEPREGGAGVTIAELAT